MAGGKSKKDKPKVPCADLINKLSEKIHGFKKPDGRQYNGFRDRAQALWDYQRTLDWKGHLDQFNQLIVSTARVFQQYKDDDCPFPTAVADAADMMTWFLILSEVDWWLGTKGDDFLDHVRSPGNNPFNPPNSKPIRLPRLPKLPQIEIAVTE
jgi:hypothetical protein